jgi:hypothetical protein
VKATCDKDDPRDIMLGSDNVVEPSVVYRDFVKVS